MNERGLTPIPLQQMKKYDVNRAGAVEAVWSPLYDYQTYPLGGTQELLFFQVPQGQSGKTRDDTNMELAGTLPAPKEFLITSILVDFVPATLPGRFNVADPASNWNDNYALHQSGHVVLSIGSKDYVVDAPLGKFPKKWGLAGVGALSGNNADAATNSLIDYARFGGHPYEVVPYRLIPTQNFVVRIRFDNGVVPITADSRIGVILNGYLYRLSQ